MNTLSRYLSEIRRTRSLGSVPETSYYPALAELLSTIGLGFSPKVRCIVHPKEQGAGIPDLALFSADQIPVGGQPLVGVLPSRGVIEAKGTHERIEAIIASKQVAKYLEKYGQVLVTNLREFALITFSDQSKHVVRERFALADSEAAFWNPTETDDALHDHFVHYLKRVLISNAPLRTPKDLAWLLASYAREALGRIEMRNLEALNNLRRGMEEALGITKSRGDRF